MTTTAPLPAGGDDTPFQSALDALDNGYLIFDANDRLVAFNDAIRGLLPQIADLFRVGVSFEALARADAEHTAGSPYAVDGWLTTRLAWHRQPRSSFDKQLPDGRWLRGSDHATSDGGRILVYRDVTDERRHAEEAERYTTLLRGTLENISQGLVAFDEHLRLMMWNARCFELLDLPDTFAQAGTPLVDIVRYQANRGEFGEGEPAVLTTQVMSMFTDPQGATYERETHKGVMLSVKVRPLGKGGFVATFSDVTERKNAEQALRDSEQRYALAATGSNDGLWDWDLVNNRIYLSERWKEMLGCAEDEIGDGAEEWFSRIHPEDVQRVTAQLDTHLSDVTSHFESEHRVRHRDESYRWMLVRGLAVRDGPGGANRIAGSMTDITDRKRAEEQSIHDALHDSLTGLPNRTLFLERVRQALSRVRRTPSARFAVIYLDLDRFKVVNESLGHAHGDDLIIAAARRLEQSLKFGDTVARLGGDEFAILLEDVADKEEATSIADILQKALSAPFTLGTKEIFTTASMGIAHSGEEYLRPEDILRDSELAMYRAKELGKARSVAFDPAMRGTAATPLDVETDLRRALDRGEMALHFQPIISLADGRIRGFEALMRWTHPERGDVPPADFIPLAEETGMIVELGEWVLRNACAQMVAWNQQHAPSAPLEVSVNISGRQFTQIDLVRMVTNSLDSSGLSPNLLKLEITESALMENAQRSVQMLQQLKELDIKICVDDFGTGYSSLSYLHTFPIDTLKIDKSFVRDMGRNRHNLEIVRTIALLAQNLRLDVIAEGVETPEQLAQLRAIGCGYAQGYLFSRALTIEAVDHLLAENRSW
ncbi:MAG: EAL domain-containing protein [Alphaproteobacteria bacterium]|nr:EAL domain-containing protein [Alphaproteobacteria bacterium]